MPHAAVLLGLAVLTPLATAAAATNHSLPGSHYCGTEGHYAPNGTYEANLRFLAATLAAKVNVSSPYPTSAHANAEQVAAFAYCLRRPDVIDLSPGTCVACVALAFRDVQRLCPYHRNAMVERGDCRITFFDVQQMEQDSGVMVPHKYMSFWRNNILLRAFSCMLPFQAIGFACLLFLFLQEWRSRRRGPAM